MESGHADVGDLLCMSKNPSVVIHPPERLSLDHDFPVPFSAGPEDDAFQIHVPAGGGKQALLQQLNVLCLRMRHDSD